MDNREDYDLAATCCNGKSEAFGILTRRHWQRVLGIFLAVLVNSDDAEDAAQEP